MGNYRYSNKRHALQFVYNGKNSGDIKLITLLFAQPAVVT